MPRLILALGLAVALGACVARPAETPASGRALTLLFTNDLESAYDPTPAYWRQDIARIGGIAELATLIRQQRALSQPSFLFDAGDIFTGTLARRTRGAVAFDLMAHMGYDAMAIGNHEFEYGWQQLVKTLTPVAFPVLAANLRYAASGAPFAQPYTIIERGGVTLGVIGLLGRDAATALIPAHIEGLAVDDPVAVLEPLVEKLRKRVDLIVVLIHQGPTAPMQTNDEGDPSVHRGNAANLALAGAVPGIDVILAGHTDAGTRAPLRHPKTGTLIMQTFGQGQHLGVLHLTLDAAGAGIANYDGGLLAVDADRLEPDPTVARALAAYRARHADLYEVIGHSGTYFARRYNAESDLGNLFADIAREAGGTPIGLMPSGALRRDLAGGPLRRVDLLDAFPFEDRLAVVTVSGRVLRAILEQGLSLQRGALQVSGLTVRYDPAAPPLQRLRSVTIAGKPIADDARYQVSTVEILAQGGDAYTSVRDADSVTLVPERFADLLEAYVARTKNLEQPARGRLLPIRGDGL
ncbi:MAG: bifunctional UDP-sugar hydrolase/5'-nucleotidase [Pseudomonadota bacterium]